MSGYIHSVLRNGVPVSNGPGLSVYIILSFLPLWPKDYGMNERNTPDSTTYLLTDVGLPFLFFFLFSAGLKTLTLP